MSVLTSQTPAQPLPPTTTWQPDDVLISWTAPNNGGSPITGYRISIVTSDGVTYQEDATHCDATQSTATVCTVPVTALKSTPFSLDWGTSVYAKVVAINAYGDSSASDAGNGAIITTSPDAPTSLTEVYEQRTKSTIGLAWTAPVFKGGAVIDEYRVSYAVQGQAFQVLESAVTATSYLATGLTAGSTYEFKVEAKNSYGYSVFSNTLTLLCAFVPEPPTTVSSANTNDLVTITWSEPVTNGSPITAYKIFVEEKGTGVFT